MNRWLYSALVVTTTALMGSSFAVGKIGLAYVSPFLLVGIRFTLAGLIMAIAVRGKGRPSQLTDWFRIAVIGIFQTAGVMGCIFLSLRTIPAGESSILTFINPLLVVVLATIFRGARYRWVQWGGVILGFAGVFITLGFHIHMHIGTILGLTGALSWAIATLLIKKWSGTFNVWVLTAYQMLIGGVVLLIAGLAFETPKLILNGTSVSIIVWLAIMASIVQFAIWFYLLQHGDPGKTSAFLFLAPFFGVLSGWAILGEKLAWSVLFGGIFIFVGIFLVNWPEPQRRKTGQTG
ncbi:DMT family transporter [Fodinisporobacter ferrooxydans]|uniref:DMT family transporter n=1 Tax=Fodinisporobacter ferrooxydans TaxID=2901836 RepID=A0ABY4CMT7_9BACL|nr:DMT family transporter [Alicyclobacillaceae bacterium MYW30-H2]